MQCVSVISEAPRGPVCHLPMEGSYVLIEYKARVRRSMRKRPRVVSFEDISHGIRPISRARFGKRSGKPE